MHRFVLIILMNFNAFHLAR